MSSLAAARADNFYRAKNYDPKKVVPKKSDFAEEKPFVVVEGQRVGGSKVRYETPFHVRCVGCQNMVAKGVRFNSIKTWVGDFHTTKIYEFRMKCPQCIQRFVVRTDPQNCDYVYVFGARRIFQAGDCTDQTRIRDEEKQKRLKTDAFARLQNQQRDKLEYGTVVANIQQLQSLQQRGLEDFQLNRALRKKARVLREEEKQYFREKLQKNMEVPLLTNTIQDQRIAQKIKFKNQKHKMIKKQSFNQRDRLKQKMKNLNPIYKKLLKQQIKANNKPSSSVFLKK